MIDRRQSREALTSSRLKEKDFKRKVRKFESKLNADKNRIIFRKGDDAILVCYSGPNVSSRRALASTLALKASYLFRAIQMPSKQAQGTGKMKKVRENCKQFSLTLIV